MPLLARMLPSPLFVDIRAGAVDGLGDLLPDRRISADGHVAVAVGPGQGEQVWSSAIRPTLRQRRRSSPCAAAASRPPASCRPSCAASSYDARGRHRRRPDPRRREVRRDAGSACRWSRSPPTSPTTASCSPVSSLEHDDGKGSFGVGLPLAVVVDLDYVRGGAAAAGAVRRRRRGEQPLARSRTGGSPHASAASRSTASPWRSPAPRPRRCCTAPTASSRDGFLIALAEALVLSGMAMSVAGHRPAVQRRLPRDHARHRPAVPRRGQPRRAGRGRRAVSRLPARTTRRLAEQIDACLRRHGLPRVPADAGAVAGAVRRGGRRGAAAPGPTATRSSSTWTSTPADSRARVDAFVEAYTRVTAPGCGSNSPVIAFRSP